MGRMMWKGTGEVQYRRRSATSSPPPAPPPAPARSATPGRSRRPSSAATRRTRSSRGTRSGCGAGRTSGQFVCQLNGSAGNWITFRGYPGERAIIDGQWNPSRPGNRHSEFLHAQLGVLSVAQRRRADEQHDAAIRADSGLRIAARRRLLHGGATFQGHELRHPRLRSGRFHRREWQNRGRGLWEPDLPQRARVAAGAVPTAAAAVDLIPAGGNARCRFPAPYSAGYGCRRPARRGRTTNVSGDYLIVGVYAVFGSRLHRIFRRPITASR